MGDSTHDSIDEVAPEIREHIEWLERLRKDGRSLPAALRYKIASVQNGKVRELAHSDVWDLQVGQSFARLAIGPACDHISILLDLARSWKGLYGLLYVLAVSRINNTTGRYQCPVQLEFSELEQFLSHYRGFLESDGRHNLWIKPLGGRWQLVYDRHNVIFAYGAEGRLGRLLAQYAPRFGPLGCFLRVLRRKGFDSGPVSLDTPHLHCYHPENDGFEERILKHWDWLWSPLQEVDVAPY